ncbi:uncharacterized protein N7483_011749 [Penicillium malachiteum]|uniref:uncharacterized protein n=1 Tax=Penicillium malachiteum TaxID=1324776 RepID=UPI00254861E1|nr:uncharacterized protein N7483_011749 [Penicillium malachiteum]KAJ5714568.1 hypothetical protein N7483_011749 [Penicillium malachiteum]
MGRFISHFRTLFNYSASVVYDHVADERSWTNQGDQEYKMGASDRIRQEITVGSNTYIFKWKVITAIPGREFTIQIVNEVGCKADGTPGVDGSLTMSYELESPGGEAALLSQTLVLDLPRGVKIEDDLFLLLVKPNSFERVHENLGKRLEENSRKEQQNSERNRDPE